MAALLAVFALAFGAASFATDASADDCPDQFPATVDAQSMIGTGMEVSGSKDKDLGADYVHWFSLAVTALLVLAVLAYLHVKAHKKD